MAAERAPIQTPFGPASTAEEVVAGLDLAGTRILITGGASGIGAETARVLAGAGADVTIAVRKPEQGEAAARAIAASTGRRVAVGHLDLVDQASVRRFVEQWQGPLDVLIDNAAVMATPLERTPEGWELQLATNHLGHFALARGLRPALAGTGGRVVALSSSAHLRSPVVFDDLHFERRPYDPWLAYGQSKTADALFAVEASRRWAADGITANALHPGAIRTNLQRHIDLDDLARHVRATGGDPDTLQWKTVEQGAATSVLLASSPLLEGVGGRYFEDCNEAGPNQPGTRKGVAAYALDPEAAARLWEVSEALLD
jgi:NAD(P)-dependent dehydrogenase (short-subunit alcohol dehydrogenase family)